MSAYHPTSSRSSLPIGGYDDSGLSRISYINLTTVSRHPSRLAQLAVDRVIARLDRGVDDRLDQLVEPELLVRGTTGPVPG